MKQTLIALGLILFIGFGLKAQSQKFTLSGEIIDAASGESLLGATIYEPSSKQGAAANEYGFYSLTLQEGSYDLVVSYIGYKTQTISIELKSDIRKKIELVSDAETIDEAVIVASRQDETQHTNSADMGTVNVRMETVKKLPALFGEIDVIKAVQLLPGVKTVGEGTSGFYVRGGNADQNLVLLDEAPIYNASHLLGFFSAFNPDAVHDIQLYKGPIPAKYGGRLSSVLDIRMKEGNKKKFELNGGIGTLMTRLAVEAPISERGSFILAGRRSYLDVLANAYRSIAEDEEDSGKLYFYDLNAKANYQLSSNHRLYVTGYFGRDVIKSDVDGIDIAWGNSTATARLNTVYSPKLFSNFTYYFSDYQYYLKFDDDIQLFDWNAKLQEHSAKMDFGAFLSPKHSLRFGLQSIFHEVNPGRVQSIKSNEVIDEFDIQMNRSVENAVYIEDEWTQGKWKVRGGIRLSNLMNLGKYEEYVLDDKYEITDTVFHDKGVYNTYWNPEPRLSARYTINTQSSVKASYNRTAQYIQLASNGNSSTPFDIWFTSNNTIKPQLADQWSLGYFKNWNDAMFNFSAEVYYKTFTDAIDFRDHAQLLLNKNLEGEIRRGVGRAYGLELLLKKEKGRLTGWLGYTISKSQNKVKEINNGHWYNAKSDKPHDLSIVATYDLKPHMSIGATFVYSTGVPATFPTGRYIFRGQAIPVYSERNGERLPDFHRLDLSLTLRSRKNAHRRLQSEWVFGVYNAYNRKNAFSIDFKQESTAPYTTYAEKSSIFSIVPSATWNVKF